MSKADEMFEELGYRKDEHGTDIWYWRDGEFGICIAKAVKRVFAESVFTAQELKAINKKCKELKWIE